MMIVQRLISFAVLLGGLVLFGTPASAAALIEAQKPCVTGADGPCHSFSGGGTKPTVIRSFAFSAPSKGKAAVSFTGSMFCSAIGSAAAQRVVDFVTQIVPAAEDVPDLTGPSANRLAVRLGAPGPDGFGLSASFNLASTRVFAVKAAGSKQYSFNLLTSRMDATIGCEIYDAAFTIIFIP